MSAVRVLIVDDSATMRALIRRTLEQDPQIQVVGEAGDPIEARAAIKALEPDVITLDIEMPNMNGIEFLERLMRLRPLPVIMVSTLTQRGAEASLAALECGAIDCVGKPMGGSGEGFADLALKVKAAAGARVKPSAPVDATPAPARYAGSQKVIAIGASTGGVEALIRIISSFPENCPATLITQHMPANFTTSFAERLDRHCAAHVKEVEDGDELKAGHVYLAPGGLTHLKVSANGRTCRLHAGDLVSGHRPSVDVLFQSVASALGARAVGVILTGMGRDGAEGLLAMRKAGAVTLGQDESTSVVYGMPRVADEMGAVQRQLPLNRIAYAALDAAADQPVRGFA
ncbi:chemotaxis-specific protein-glutamate methyltransferase CheB [Rhizobium sp. CRIBSB]|nr:chemotaxis-specific protein-glutamate methyltransferase CheB [Rhizobium sp. CRIBSB]